MAKVDEAVKSPTFEFGEYTGVEPEGKFDEEVEALIARGEDWPQEKIDAGVRPTITVNFPKTQENKSGVEKDVVAKYRRYFQDAAKRHNKTAREVGFAEQGDGSVNMTFVLTDQIKRPRKPKEEGDTPEAAEEATAE